MKYFQNKIKVVLIGLINLISFQSCLQVKVNDKDSILSVISFFKVANHLTIDSLVCNNRIDSFRVAQMFNIPVYDVKYYELYYNISGFPQYVDWYEIGETRFISKRGLLTIRALNKIGSISVNMRKVKSTLTDNNFGVSKIVFTNQYEGNYIDRWFGNRKIDFYLNFRLIDRSGNYPSFYKSVSYIDPFSATQEEEYNTILMLAFWSEPSDRPNNLTMRRNILLDPYVQEVSSCEILSPIQH
ncbi:hypothetical protein [Fluviicola taffensis]|uniref:Lipoprotein n=1 Tax=Fluviicola taffensis (strain DSM 16823 / NCIMB 13979 / RW262) TaxID=755732 RepID=F2IEX3_FLUTR|nr:hypothetical protein [Fluviicola taffensis]AEA42438.1 hypothetical protein Fluta_0432 [Fluviicola taffensis DSM 16823]